MKEINSAYVCLTQGEGEQEMDFAEGFPWSMPDEVLASLYALLSPRMSFACHRGQQATLQVKVCETMGSVPEVVCLQSWCHLSS